MQIYLQFFFIIYSCYLILSTIYYPTPPYKAVWALWDLWDLVVKLSWTILVKMQSFYSQFALKCTIYEVVDLNPLHSYFLSFFRWWWRLKVVSVKSTFDFLYYYNIYSPMVKLWLTKSYLQFMNYLHLGCLIFCIELQYTTNIQRITPQCNRCRI